MYQSDPEEMTKHVREWINSLHREASLHNLRRLAHPAPPALRQKIGWTLIRWGTSLAGARA